MTIFLRNPYTKKMTIYGHKEIIKIKERYATPIQYYDAIGMPSQQKTAYNINYTHPILYSFKCRITIAKTLRKGKISVAPICHNAYRNGISPKTKYSYLNQTTYYNL